MFVSKFIRLLHIQFILARYSVDRLIFTTPWFAPFHFLSYLNPWNWRRNPAMSRGQSLRLALEALGPIFVKFGQVLSTRRDLLPVDIADELALLQDQVPPFPVAVVYTLIQQVYGQPVLSVFKSFSAEPIASASIAQVHGAITFDNKDVVVKILRPGIKKIIERDVALLYTLATLIEKFWHDGPRFHPREVVAEFERSLLDELDMMREAANASQLRRNFEGSDLLYVPEIEWPLTRMNIMVMERIYGVRISLLDELKRQKVNLKRLAEMGVEIFFTQVFRDCFFHADMHPGNIFVDTKNPEHPKYLAVDFGIMGTLNPVDQRYLAENFLAFFKRDYRRVAELHVASGWVPYDTRVDEFESAIRTVCEPIFEKPLQDISYGQILMRLFQTARRFNMEIQPQLVLLQKTLINIEGLGRQLYPQLDLWSTAKPFLERWLREQVGVRGSWRKLRRQMPFFMEKFVEMPELVYNSLQFVQTLQKQQAITARSLAKSQKSQRSFLQGIIIGVVIAGVVAMVAYWRVVR